MTPSRAVETTLTRPATRGELRHARERVRLAANADRTRLMAVHSARSPDGALHVLRRRLGTRLPIDILTTHYPDRRNQILLNTALSHPADAARRLENRLESLLAHHTLEEILACAARALPGRHHHRIPAAP